MRIPEQTDKIADWAMDIIETCRASASARAALARSLKQWKYTGSPDGDAAIYNYLIGHLERLGSYLFSPADLRFQIEFDVSYPKDILDKASAASRVLTREFERRSFGQICTRGVDIALAYGCAITKSMWGHSGAELRLVMPWQFGVYREDRNTFDEQEAVCETNYITTHDLWRRISHLPDAESMFKRAKAHAKKQTATETADSYFHQVLISGTPPVVQTDPPFLAQPGGLIQVTADPIGAIIAPEVAQELCAVHELWVTDDQKGDRIPIQIAEPDILIYPRYKRENLFVEGMLPYNKIEANQMEGYFWGRSEIADLMKLQHLLRDRLEDIKKIMGQQYDKFLAFLGFNGDVGELYDNAKEQGWISVSDPTAKIEDLTPKLPPEAFADIKQITEFMSEVSGFQNILSGQGEPGVRAGVHAQTLMKTASPRLRDRALLIESQVGDIGDSLMKLMEAKRAQVFWPQGKAGQDDAEFLLAQLPDDYAVSVDSHSSSPIYEEDHREMVAFLFKAGIIDGETAIELLHLPHKDLILERYGLMMKKKQAEAQFMLQHPELIQGGKGKKAG